MADDAPSPGANPKNGSAQLETAEDAAARATSQEPKQPSISDKPSNEGEEKKPDGDCPETPSVGASEAQDNELNEQISLPKKKRSHDQLEGTTTTDVSKTQDNGLNEQIPLPKKKRSSDELEGTPIASVSKTQDNDLNEQNSLPKKKRSHDQLEGIQEPQENESTHATSPESANGQTVDCEPEKKRPRENKSNDTTKESPLSEVKDNAAEKNQHDINTDSGKISRDVPTISFANSAFGQLASQPSGFATLQPSQRKGFSSATPKPSSLDPTPSSFVSQPKSAIPDHEPSMAAPKFSFSSSSGASPFAGLSSNTNGFKGIGFGLPSALSGSKPFGGFTPFGTTALQSDKAARPFGAPDSDADEDDEEDEEDGEEGDSEGQLADKVRRASPDKDSEDKKRPKLQKVEVDDGEAGEITVVSVRAKMFSLDKESGWKERGAGMLKINVPYACVEFDDSGAVIPGSFDASGLDADEKSADDGVSNPKVARLILRQDQTHRVILNTAILPAMEFQEKSSLKSVGILFTIFEGNGGKPVSITMRMSAANAKLFLNEINAIQRELRGQ
ncbi:hypothetical protein E4U55_006997 [Claviceps digitariae]|nr:hypothetical protein E4U55_006997 [Claviceps digitariae]